MSSIPALFDAAERLELLAAEMYRLLAEQFAAKEAVRALFWRLHQEEIQHAARVRLLAAQHRKDSGLFEGAMMFEGAPDPTELVAGLQATVREVEAGAWGHDLREIRARLVALERRCVSLHAQFIAAGATPEISSFFEELARQDVEHERLLEAL